MAELEAMTRLDEITAEAIAELRERVEIAFLGRAPSCEELNRRYTYRTDPLRIVDTKTGKETALTTKHS